MFKKSAIAKLSFFLCFICIRTFAVGESAVITLEFPSGAENTGMGESGVSLDNSIYCAFFNPASVASFGKKQEIQFCYSRFQEALLPSIGLSDLYHTDTTFGLFLSSFIPYVDFGYIHYTNYINMGMNEWTDTMGVSIGPVHSYEVVNANIFGLTVLDAISIGGTIKTFNSQLAPTQGPIGPGTARGTNYDFGMRFHKQFPIKSIVTIEPAIGVAWQTLGKASVFYVDPSNSDPLPRKLLYGMSLTADVLGLFSYTGCLEMDRQDFHVSNSWTDSNNVVHATSYDARERVYHEGHRFGITPFYARYSGYLYDYHGTRLEKTNGTTLTFNYRLFMKSIISIADLFDKNIGININKIETKFIPGIFRLNFYYSKSRNSIHCLDTSNVVREGQTRSDLAWGFNISGSLASIRNSIAKVKAASKNVPAVPKLQAETAPQKPEAEKPKPPKKQEQKNVIILEDGDLVE